MDWFFAILVVGFIMLFVSPVLLPILQIFAIPLAMFHHIDSGRGRRISRDGSSDGDSGSGGAV